MGQINFMPQTCADLSREDDRQPAVANWPSLRFNNWCVEATDICNVSPSQVFASWTAQWLRQMIR
jgi:hypothetical protein